MGNPITDRMKIGAVGELLVQLRLLEFGVQAAPPIKDTGNDLIAVRGEVFRGIQVKTTAYGKTCKRPLPDHYHILAIVQLESSETELFLDRSRIFLIQRSVLEGNGGRPPAPTDLPSFSICQNHIDYLFPLPPKPTAEPSATSRKRDVARRER